MAPSPEPAPSAAAPAASPAAPIDQLKELGELHASGVLTDEEFAAQKAKLLGS
jgi:Short C-terminal domain